MACIICNSSNTFEFIESIMRCADCDAIFRNDLFESKNYFLKEESKKQGKKDFKFWEIIAKQYVKYLKQKTPMNFKNVLDVGSYFGHFVKMLNDKGINARGVEANKTRVSQAVTDKIEWGYFDQVFDTDEKFDLICFTEMLYYLPNGIPVLNFARTLLTDNGLIFIATVNPSSSLVKNKEIPAVGSEYVNVLLSKKNFESLNNFELVDYSPYRTNIFIDLYKKNKFAMIGYFIGMKQPYTPDPDGNHAFILLKTD